MLLGAGKLGGGGSSGGAEILSAEVILDNAEILALPSAYQEVVAGEAGKLFIPVASIIEFNFQAAGYTNVHAGNYMGLAYGDFDVGASDLVKFFEAGGDNRTVVLGIAGYPDETLQSVVGIPSSKTAMNGASLKVFAVNSDGNFVGGDAANTMKVTVLYIALDVS